MTPIPPLAQAALAVFAAMTLLWLLSLERKDASIVDVAWGPAFAMTAWVYIFAAPAPGSPAWLLVALVNVWGLRLGLHIFLRNRGHGEDRRYAAMRADGGDAWWLTSLFKVFYLQGALVLVIGAPLHGALARPADRTWIWLVAVGVLVWAVGFVFEAGGDRQLMRFKADPSSRGKVLDTGFWRFTRHPNYFGDAMVWWGHWLIAVGMGAPWWTVFAPLAMNLLLLEVSGVALLEKDIGDRRPAYRAYIERTNAFWPGPPREAGRR